MQNPQRVVIVSRTFYCYVKESKIMRWKSILQQQKRVMLDPFVGKYLIIVENSNEFIENISDLLSKRTYQYHSNCIRVKHFINWMIKLLYLVIEVHVFRDMVTIKHISIWKYTC